MLNLVFFLVAMIAVGVAFRYGYLYSQAKSEAKRFEALFDEQTRLVRAFGEVLNESSQHRLLLEKIDHASTIEELQTIYNELISG